MIPALPDKDDDNPPPLGPPAAATNSPQLAARGPPERHLRPRGFLTSSAINSMPRNNEEAIVESLLPHDFSRAEVQRLVRELAAKLGRGRIGQKGSGSRTNPMRSEFDGIQR